MKLALLALPLLVALGSAAYAGDEGGSSAPPSACSADVQKYCASAANDADRKSCLQTNQEKVTEACRTAMTSSSGEEQPHGY